MIEGGFERYDVVIVGAGPVGLAAAVELHAAGLKLIVLEARGAEHQDQEWRPLALSYGSRLILERLAVWEELSASTTPIDHIHVSQRGRFGITTFSAADAELPALGYVADYTAIAAALRRHAAARDVPISRGARVSAVAHQERQAQVTYENAAGTHHCMTSLVIIADGSADATGVGVRVVDYGQSAITAIVRTERPQRQTAYERFTPEGPLALLPYGEDFALVWTIAPERAEQLCAALPDAFLNVLETHFGERCGRFESVSQRSAQRLTLRVSKTITAERLVLIGNAAQALHPVAGQGFNLGLRDAWELAQEIRRSDVVAEGLLRNYRARRRIDRAAGIGVTHGLVKTFSNDSSVLGLGRSLGLTALECLPFAKDVLVKRMIFGARGS